MKSLSSLPQGLLAAYYRNQPDQVKQNLKRILFKGSFEICNVNLSKAPLKENTL